MSVTQRYCGGVECSSVSVQRGVALVSHEVSVEVAVTRFWTVASRQHPKTDRAHLIPRCNLVGIQVLIDGVIYITVGIHAELELQLLDADYQAALILADGQAVAV